MNKGKVLLGVLAVAATGALIGVLFAPHKGVVTRKKISRSYGSITDDVKEKFNDFVDSVSEKYEKVKGNVSDFAEQKLNKNGDVRKEVKAS
jgi:gas vesicle protein